MRKYIKPKIESKKYKISFFLSQSSLTDSMGFLFGNVVHADSCGPGCSANYGGSQCGDNSVGYDGGGFNSSFDSSSGFDIGGT